MYRLNVVTFSCLSHRVTENNPLYKGLYDLNMHENDMTVLTGMHETDQDITHTHVQYSYAKVSSLPFLLQKGR